MSQAKPTINGPEINTTCGADLKVTLNGVEYLWGGGFGSVLKSCERSVKRGEVRIIGGVIFYAEIYLNRGTWTREISWIPQARFDADWMRAFKAAIFGC